MHTNFVLVVLGVIGVATAFRPLPPADNPLCSGDGDAAVRVCDFVPNGCLGLTPICAVDSLGQARWFKNMCYLGTINGMCRTNFRRTMDTNCPAESRPETGPCPWPQGPRF